MKTRTYSPTPSNLRRLAAMLSRGGLVAIPTETVYGLAANALDEKACEKIFRAKGRPTQDPLIVHVLNLQQAEQLAEFSDAARQIVRKFWPGPLTLILPKKPSVPQIVTAGRDTVALRSPAHPLARRLIRLAGIPLAAPSANLFGYVSPTSAAHVRDGLEGKIPAILDSGECRIGVESTILDLTDARSPRILRPGAITATDLEKALHLDLRQTTGKRMSLKPRSGLLAPGMLPQHYSPHTPLTIKRDLRKLPANTGVIFLRKPSPPAISNSYWLSKNGSLSEVARSLYRVLREADHGGHRQIWIEALPENPRGLAAAINDRIHRAAAKR